ncbi:MAG: ABC transporter substrate-binding protein [Anaerolineae bacterium]|nr:ABC transporter substrate-binding protein [Anaerolineae bacterium]
MKRLARLVLVCALGCAALLIGGCAALPGNAAPVVKLGVIAPFEGAGRPLGYAVLPAIKAVVAEANASGDLGAARIAVVAFNDSLDPATAARQAEALALDGDVFAVIGPFTEGAAAAARPALDAAGLRGEPVISTDPLDGDYSDEIAAAEKATRGAIKALINRLNLD